VWLKVVVWELLVLQRGGQRQQQRQSHPGEWVRRLAVPLSRHLLGCQWPPRGVLLGEARDNAEPKTVFGSLLHVSMPGLLFECFLSVTVSVISGLDHFSCTRLRGWLIHEGVIGIQVAAIVFLGGGLKGVTHKLFI